MALNFRSSPEHLLESPYQKMVCRAGTRAEASYAGKPKLSGGLGYEASLWYVCVAFRSWSPQPRPSSTAGGSSMMW